MLAAGGDPVIAAAGDIACDPSSSSFNGGNGTSGSCRQKATSDLLASLGVAAVLPLGDNQYYCGGYNAFLQSYDPSWGRLKSITHPSVGNHEYLTSGGTDCNTANAGADGYFKYFGAAAGIKGQGYYSFDIGTWHLIALNTNCSSAGGCGATSPQGKWLAADLAAHPAACTLAYWHIPLYSSGGRANGNSKPFWQLLYDNNADLILSAHDHTYERFAPQTPNGTLDNARGIREFIVGTGGANHTSFPTLAANSEVRNATTYGVLELTLHPTSYDWRFVPVPGQTFTDSGTTACHGTSSDLVAPTAPTNLSATAVGSGHVDLSWTASTDDVAVSGYGIYRNGARIGSSTGTSYPDMTADPNTSYVYYVVAYDTSNNISSPSNQAPVQTPPDTTPPTTPTNLVATAAGATEVGLAWSSSTDDVRVAGYDVLRDGVAIGTSTTTTYRDTTAQPETTYVYRVRAFDAAGNTSDPSSAATGTTPPQPSVLSFAPADDTYVRSDQPTVNFGSTASLQVDGSPTKRMLLRFVVSGVGARSVLGAKLRLHCVDASNVGGVFHRVTAGTWSENTVTWNSQPTYSALPLASLGSVNAGEFYEVDLGTLVTGDGQYELAVDSLSSNGADFDSSEGAAGLSPELIVTTSG